MSYPGGADLPLISTLPAFQKLHDQLFTPELSLQILQDSKQQILGSVDILPKPNESGDKTYKTHVISGHFLKP